MSAQAMTRAPQPHPSVAEPGAGTGVSRVVIASSVTGTIALALGAFWLSFTTLQDLALMAGIPAGQAWVWPLIVDGVILEATISVVALRHQPAPARRFAWLLLAAGAGVSVAANITHAIVAADARVPALIAALVASVPPLVLLAMTHLTVELTRHTQPAPAAPNAGAAMTPKAAEGPRADGRSDAHRTPRAPRPRLSTGARQRAVELARSGSSQRQIAAELGVHPTTVGRWLSTPDHPDEGDPS